MDVAVHHEEEADEHDGDADDAVLVRFLLETEIGEERNEDEIGGEDAGGDGRVQTSGTQ